MALPTVGGGYQYTDGNQNEMEFLPQVAPATASVTATLTAAQLAAGIITINQAGAAACTLTLPTGALMDATFTNRHGSILGLSGSLSNIHPIAIWGGL